MNRFRLSICILALLLLSFSSFAGVYLAPIATGPLSEGRTARIPIGTSWADVRAYSFAIEPGTASCTGNGTSRICSACSAAVERASFQIIWWNGTQASVNSLAEGATGEVANQFKLKVIRISETQFVDNVDTGQCRAIDANVNFEFSPFMPCATDGDCPNGLGCADYKCVQTECTTNNDCADGEYCTNRQCYSVSTGACGYVANHAWNPYSCCANTDCRADQRCANHECRTYRYCSRSEDCGFDELCNNATLHCDYLAPGSDCGRYVNHAWVDYECCNSTGCPAGESCHEHFCTGCVSNSDCASSERCESSVCVEITGCGLIANHTITPYECCVNSDCFDEFACVAHECNPVSCPCGSIVNHTCVVCTPTPAPTATPEPTATPQGSPSPSPTPASSACGAGFALLALVGFASLNKK